jgi:type III pantothenate kinase
MTFLAIDIGNTRLKWALYERGAPGAPLLAQGVEFLEHIERLAETDWANLPAPERVLGCVVAGDPIKRRVREQLEIWDSPVSWVVPSAAEAGVTNGYDFPARLGADRWVAMIGARHRVQATTPGRPLVVVMVGTAVTVDAGACERMIQHLRAHCGAEPRCLMTGGAGWKMAPHMSAAFELVDSIIFDGLLVIAEEREAIRQRLAAS